MTSTGRPDSSDPIYGWRWDDPRWRTWTGSDPAKLLFEALRRAVDIRDRSAEHVSLGARPLFMVDVLNELCKAMAVDGSDLWSVPPSVEE